MHQIRRFPSWINCVLVWLQKSEWFGKHRFYLWMARHFPSKVITHHIDNRLFHVPVGEWCFWLEKGPENYYLDEFLPFCDALNAADKPFTLLDLGADIGTVSSLMAVHCRHLKNVVAFEPNPKSFAILTANLDNLHQSADAIQTAVSNFDGMASFHADPSRINDHEGYIERAGQGDTAVTSLDSWYRKQDSLVVEKTVALKIDVEGQEIQLLEGAQSLIEGADKVLILIEIHPEVLARTQHSPEHLFSAAEQVREFDWSVPLLAGKQVDRNVSFFEQFPVGQYDIIGISR